MTTHELNGKIVGVVEVPANGKDPDIVDNAIILYWLDDNTKPFDKTTNKANYFHYKLPSSGWQILSLASEMTEEQSATLGMTLKEFKEWLKSLGFVVENEMGDTEPDIENYLSGRQHAHFVRKWQEAQKLVQNLLIIVKEK